MRALRLLVTAGPTREYLDPVRYLSNDSSGRMGVCIAEAARRRGMRVTLVHGPLAVAQPAGVRAVAVVSAAEMLAACEELWPRHDALVMAAAVADYAPVRRAKCKRKKDAGELVLRLRPTPDILARLAAARRVDQVVVGFALEDRAARARAARKLESKQLDAIVLNTPAAIGAERSVIEILIRDGGWRVLPRATKRRQAEEVVRVVELLRGGRRAPSEDGSG
jgi:phosphopantothenoylcysteine decarboxylase/phosphopantothenate--cysteine ligase